MKPLILILAFCGSGCVSKSKYNRDIWTLAIKSVELQMQVDYLMDYQSREQRSNNYK